MEERMDYDGWWKDVIECYWPDFLSWALPELYKYADLTKKPEFLSKELRDTIHLPDGEDHNSAYFVDELVKIHMKDGGEELKIMPPLYVHNADGSYTDEIDRIYGRKG